ncbi:hypothetical protein ACFWQK_09055 [Brachybacterium paraconglomeratum]
MELRNSENRIIIYRHQIMPFCDYATDWVEHLEQLERQEDAG